MGHLRVGGFHQMMCEARLTTSLQIIRGAHIHCMCQHQQFEATYPPDALLRLLFY